MAVIRVSGMLGSGKTTLCKELARTLKYDYLYTGGVFREMAQERGMTLEEFYQELEADPELEKSVDERQVAVMAKNWVVAEGRMAPFLPCPHKTINVYLDVSEDVAVRRLMQRKENEGRSEKDMRERLRQRLAGERTRYRKLYFISDHLDKSKFDIVIDTTRSDERRVLFNTLRLLFDKVGFQLLRPSKT